MVLSDSVDIRCTAEQAFAWFMSLDTNYGAWHPDHIECRFSTEGEIGRGTVVGAKEYLHSKVHVLRMRISEIVPNKLIGYQNMFPMSLIMAFTAEADFRLGTLTAKLFRKQYAELRNQMREESPNLRTILESPANAGEH
jgi:hypothetical protein